MLYTWNLDNLNRKKPEFDFTLFSFFFSEVLIFGGDILKFAGMGASWEGRGRKGMPRCLCSDKGGISVRAVASTVGERMLEEWVSVQITYKIGWSGQKPTVCLSLQGDALLALWKVERRQLKNIITVVIKCSLEIHGLFETQESEEGLDIRVKIGKLLRKERYYSSLMWVLTPWGISLLKRKQWNIVTQAHHPVLSFGIRPTRM